jgi:hypothetical protein
MLCSFECRQSCHGASAAGCGPKPAGLLPTKSASPLVLDRARVRRCGSQTVVRICCRQQSPSHWSLAEAPFRFAGVWRNPSNSPARLSALTAITVLTAAASESAALRLWPRLIDGERSASRLLAIQRRHGFIRLVIIGHGNEAEPARSSAIAVGNKAGALDGAIRLEQRP